jgi:hypothetical protein
VWLHVVFRSQLIRADRKIGKAFARSQKNRWGQQRWRWRRCQPKVCLHLDRGWRFGTADGCLARSFFPQNLKHRVIKTAAPQACVLLRLWQNGGRALIGQRFGVGRVVFREDARIGPHCGGQIGTDRINRCRYPRPELRHGVRAHLKPGMAAA